MPYSKSGPVAEVMRPAFLPGTCSACTRNFANRRVGRWRSPILPKELPAGIRKLSSMSGEKVYTEFLNTNREFTAFSGFRKQKPRAGYIPRRHRGLCCPKQKNL